MTEVLPLALQYGMSVDEFWHGDKRLYNAYQKAYYNRIYETAWLNGLYINIAIQNTAGNILAQKGAKPLEYPSAPHNPFKSKKSIKREDIARDYRALQQSQNDFIKSLLAKN